MIEFAIVTPTWVLWQVEEGENKFTLLSHGVVLPDVPGYHNAEYMPCSFFQHLKCTS